MADRMSAPSSALADTSRGDADHGVVIETNPTTGQSRPACLCGYVSTWWSDDRIDAVSEGRAHVEAVTLAANGAGGGHLPAGECGVPWCIEKHRTGKQPVSLRWDDHGSRCHIGRRHQFTPQPDPDGTFTAGTLSAQIMRFDDGEGDVPCVARVHFSVSEFDESGLTSADLLRLAAWLLERAAELDEANSDVVKSLAIPGGGG